MSNSTCNGYGEINIYIDGELRSVRRRKRRKSEQMFEMNQYAVVERALIVAYEVEPKNIPALRSRLGALQRGGLFGVERPGKGRKLGYGPDQFWRLVFALELNRLGHCPVFDSKINRGILGAHARGGLPRG